MGRRTQRIEITSYWTPAQVSDLDRLRERNGGLSRSAMSRKLAIDQLRYVVFNERFRGKRPKRSKSAANHSPRQTLEVWIRELLDRDFPPEVVAQRAVIRGGNHGVPISPEEARQLVDAVMREDGE